MGSSSTQKVELDEMELPEKNLMNATIDSIPLVADSLGFDTIITVNKLEDDSKYKGFNSQLADIDSRIAELDAYSAKYPNAMQDANIQNQKRALQEQRQNISKELGDYTTNFDEAKSFDFKKKQDPYEKRLIEQYGEAEGKKKFAEHTGQVAEANAELTKASVDQALKFARGDYALNAEQKKYFEDTYAPILSSIDALYTDLDKQITNTDKTMDQALNEYMTQVKATDMDIGAALTIAADTAKETGRNMAAALSDTIKVRDKLAKMGIEDKTNELTKASAINSALIGRAPDDPEYDREVQSSVARIVKEKELQFADMEASGLMGIAERTGGKLEDISQQRVGLAERTGAGLENAYLTKYNQAGSTGAKREANIAQAGGSRLAAAEGRAGAEMNVAMGLPPSQVATGLNVGQYNQAVAAQAAQNAGALNATVANQANTYFNRRAAEPTTTTTQSYGVGDFLGDIAGAAGGIGSAYFGFKK